MLLLNLFTKQKLHWLHKYLNIESESWKAKLPSSFLNASKDSVMT